MPPLPIAPRIRLGAVRARDLMTPTPASLRHTATAREAAAVQAGRGLGAAPVVDNAGRAVGVLYRSDVVLAANAGVRAARVGDVMTLTVIAVRPDDTALDVSGAMVRHLVHRMFVVDSEGVRVGMAGTSDLLRGLPALWGATAAPLPAA